MNKLLRNHNQERCQSGLRDVLTKQYHQKYIDLVRQEWLLGFVLHLEISLDFEDDEKICAGLVDTWFYHWSRSCIRRWMVENVGHLNWLSYAVFKMPELESKDQSNNCLVTIKLAFSCLSRKDGE